MVEPNRAFPAATAEDDHVRVDLVREFHQALSPRGAVAEPAVGPRVEPEARERVAEVADGGLPLGDGRRGHLGVGGEVQPATRGLVLVLVEDVRQDDLRVRRVRDVRGRDCESVRQVVGAAEGGEDDRVYAHTRTEGRVRLTVVKINSNRSDYSPSSPSRAIPPSAATVELYLSWS